MSESVLSGAREAFEKEKEAFRVAVLHYEDQCKLADKTPDYGAFNFGWHAGVKFGLSEGREQAARACVDMAERYDADIEGCDADELLEYGEGITCSFRLAYIIKYGKFPPEGDAWMTEFSEIFKAIRSLGATQPK